MKRIPPDKEAARKGGSVKAAESKAKAAALAALHASRRDVPVHPLPARVSAALVVIRELMDAHYRPNVAAERQPLRATLGSLANDLGVNSRSLRRWLAGEQRPDPCHHRALLNWASLLKKRALAILSHTQKGLKE